MPPFIVDVVRLGVWLALLTAVFVPLERAFALHPAKWRRAGFATDLGHYFINSLLPAALIAAPLALLATGLQRILPPGFHALVHALPLWVTIPAGLIVADIGSYWGHRLSHEIPFLWRFHAVHHSAEHIDWLVNTRAHPLDMVVTRLAGLTPLYLLGLGTAGASGSLLPVVVTLLGTFAGFFVHANVRWRLGWFEQLLSTPAFHHWHHSRRDHIDRNYAATLPVIDRIFGTYYLPDHWPTEYGTDTPVAATLAGQLAHPWRTTDLAERVGFEPTKGF